MESILINNYDNITRESNVELKPITIFLDKNGELKNFINLLKKLYNRKVYRRTIIDDKIMKNTQIDCFAKDVIRHPKFINLRSDIGYQQLKRITNHNYQKRVFFGKDFCKQKDFEFLYSILKSQDFKYTKVILYNPSKIITKRISKKFNLTNNKNVSIYTFENGGIGKIEEIL